MIVHMRSCWLLAVLMLSASERAVSLVLHTRRETGDFDRHPQPLPLDICLDYCNALQSDKSSPVSDGTRLVPPGVQGLLLCILADQCKGFGGPTTVYRIQRNSEEVEYNCLYPNCQQNVNQSPLSSSDLDRTDDVEDRSYEGFQGDGMGVEDRVDLVLSKRGFSDITDVCIEFHCSAKTPGSFAYLKCVSDNRCIGR